MNNSRVVNELASISNELINGVLDISGNVFLSGTNNNVVINDVNFTTSQSDNLNIKIQNVNPNIEALAINLQKLADDEIKLGNGEGDPSGLGGVPRVVIANDNDAVNTRFEKIGLQGADSTVSVDIGNSNSGVLRCVLASNQPIVDVSVNDLDLVLQSNVGINTSPNITNKSLRGYNTSIDSGGQSQVSDGFSSSGQFLTLPDIAGISSFDVVSTSINDDGGGTGARTIRVIYEDVNGVVDDEKVDLNGTTPVLITGLTGCMRFIRAVVNTTGSSLINEGLITIYETSVSANIYEQINIGNNISASAKLFIPEDKTFFCRHLNINMFSTGLDDVSLDLQIKRVNNDFWVNFQHFVLRGSNSEDHNWNFIGTEIDSKIFNPIGSGIAIDLRFIAEKLSAGGDARISINFSGFYK